MSDDEREPAATSDRFLNGFEMRASDVPRSRIPWPLTGVAYACRRHPPDRSSFGNGLRLVAGSAVQSHRAARDAREPVEEHPPARASARHDSRSSRVASARWMSLSSRGFRRRMLACDSLFLFSLYDGGGSRSRSVDHVGFGIAGAEWRGQRKIGWPRRS